MGSDKKTLRGCGRKAQRQRELTCVAGAGRSLWGPGGHVAVQGALGRGQHGRVRERGAGGQGWGHQGAPWVAVG